MFVQISEKPVDIVLEQMDVLTRNRDEDEKGKLYEEISEILHQEGRGQMMGDFNSIVREGSTDKVIGPFGLGIGNKRGNILIDFCK